MRITGKSFTVFTLVSECAFIFFVALILCVFGTLTLSGSFGDYEKTTATITEITLNDDMAETIVSYNVGGVVYSSALGYYSSDMEVGKEITIKYSPEDPTVIRAQSIDFIGYALFGGAALMVFLGYKIIKRGLKILKEGGISYASIGGMGTVCSSGNVDTSTFPPKEQGELYYFHFDKNFNQGHVMENRNRQVVYEGTNKSFTLLRDYEMDFVNHISLHTETHRIGHSGSAGTRRARYSLGFNYDGQNIWQYLSGRGVEMNVSFDRGMTGMTYDIALGGVPFARFETSGSNLYGEEKQGFAKIGNLSAPGLFRIYSYSNDIDLLFLIGVAITRSRV